MKPGYKSLSLGLVPKGIVHLAERAVRDLMRAVVLAPAVPVQRQQIVSCAIAWSNVASREPQARASWAR
jgi:hypothetical protein